MLISCTQEHVANIQELDQYLHSQESRLHHVCQIKGLQVEVTYLPTTVFPETTFDSVHFLEVRASYEGEDLMQSVPKNQQEQRILSRILHYQMSDYVSVSHCEEDLHVMQCMYDPTFSLTTYSKILVVLPKKEEACDLNYTFDFGFINGMDKKIHGTFLSENIRNIPKLRSL